MEAIARKSFQMKIIVNIFPRISLLCKLVPVQYWEYEYGVTQRSRLSLLHGSFISHYLHKINREKNIVTTHGYMATG